MWQVFWRCSPLLSRVTFLRNSRRKPRRPSSPLPRLRLLVVLRLLSLPKYRFQVLRSPLQHRRQFPAALKPLAPVVQRSLSLPKGLFQVARRSQAPAAFRSLYLPKCPRLAAQRSLNLPKGCRAARNPVPLSSPVPIRLWLLSPILRWLIRPRQPIRRS